MSGEKKNHSNRTNFTNVLFKDPLPTHFFKQVLPKYFFPISNTPPATQDGLLN